MFSLLAIHWIPEQILRKNFGYIPRSSPGEIHKKKLDWKIEEIANDVFTVNSKELENDEFNINMNSCQNSLERF